MKKLLWLKVFCILLGAAAALLYGQIQHEIYAKQKYIQPIIIQIPNGASLQKIGQILAQNKLVAEPWQFVIYAKFNKLYPQMKAGEYLIDEPVSLYDLGNILTSGKIYWRRITIAEGLTSREIMDELWKNEFLDGDINTFGEGQFLPETYTFFRGEKRQNIVKQAQKAMQTELQNAWDKRDADLPLKNKEELLILASIVEKETGIAAERPRVASVFVNRLRKGMLLQTDPTVIYAITQGQSELNRPLTRKDLQIDSPHNTYKYAGLPPAPICNPGKEAIWAAAHPDKTPYLYFVASGDGGHNFSSTLAEHNVNVRKWRNSR